MHPFSVLTLGIFVAGYITARWDLVTRLCELAIFAWEHGVVVSSLLLDTCAARCASSQAGYVCVCAKLCTDFGSLFFFVSRHALQRELSASLASSLSSLYPSFSWQERRRDLYARITPVRPRPPS